MGRDFRQLTQCLQRHADWIAYWPVLGSADMAAHFQASNPAHFNDFRSAHPSLTRPRTSELDAARIIEIVLERGPCFGTCPVFRFAASCHAGYVYEGHAHVEPLGRRTGGFPGHLFDRLAGACGELRGTELDDVYPCDFEDAPSVSVTVRRATGIKVVRSEGDSGPVRLWAFATPAEAVMRRVFDGERRSRGNLHA